MKRKLRLFCILFLAPALVLYVVFVVGPLVASAWYSLTEWDGIASRKFIAGMNFLELLGTRNYWMMFANTAKMVGISVAIQVPLGLVLAYLLYRRTRGFKVVRAILFLPVVIAPIAVGLMFRLFYNSEIGLLNGLLAALHLSSWQRQWLSDPHVLLYMVILPQVWQYIGLYVVIFFAALQSLPEQIFESATIDGASSTRSFFSMAVPLVWEVIQLAVILCVTGSMKAFEHPWIMTQGGPGYRSSYLTVYMFRVAFLERRFGYGSAVAISIVVLSLAFTVLYRRLAGREGVEYS